MNISITYTNGMRFRAIKTNPFETDENFVGGFIGKVLAETERFFKFEIEKKPLTNDWLHQIVHENFWRSDGQYILRGDFVSLNDAVEFVSQTCYIIEATQCDWTPRSMKVEATE